MVLHIDSDTGEAPRPKRVAMPSAKVISADNAADQELPSHRRAYVASRAADSEVPAQPVGRKRLHSPDLEELQHESTSSNPSSGLV